MKDLLWKLLIVLVICVVIWIALSYIQVLAHNMDGATGTHFTYPVYNFFNWITNTF